MFKKSILFTLFSVLVSAALSFPAFAQTEVVNIKADSISLFPRHFYTVEFFNNPQESESKFTMRLASYGEVAGCAHMSDPELETQMVSNRLKLKVTDSEVLLDDEEPRYSPYDCETKINRSFFDVPLDRNELIRKKIKKIKLDSEEYGDFIEAEIDVNEDRIEFLAKSQGGSHLITFWFFPKNSIALYAPAAKTGQNVTDMIRALGVQHGLTPMEDRLEGYELPYTAQNYVLFTDPSRKLLSDLETVDARIHVGDITPFRTVHGLNGPQQELYEMAVFASVPKQKK